MALVQRCCGKVRSHQSVLASGGGWRVRGCAGGGGLATMPLAALPGALLATVGRGPLQ
jgi:hypothetical protein